MKKIVGYVHGSEAGSLSHIERITLGRTEARSLLSSFPEDVLIEIAEDENLVSENGSATASPLFDAADTVSILSVSPDIDQELSGTVEFTIDAAFVLQSEEEATLILGLGSGLGDIGLCLDLPCAQATILAGRNTVTLHFEAQITDTWPESVVLLAKMASDNEYSFLNSLNWEFSDYTWSVSRSPD